jgi:hypothetical protein
VSRFIVAKDKQAFIDRFPRNIEPPTDDRPYFFNFTRWSDLRRSARYIDEAPAVSQGNPYFLLGQLGFSTTLAIIMILGPVVGRREHLQRAHLGRFLLYFGAVGLGFIGIEIVLIQKLLLFLGHPVYSITVTLFSMLVFTGIGSMLSERWFEGPTRAALLVPVVLAGLIGLFVLLHPTMVHEWIVLPTVARISLTLVLLAPIGLCLGIPFAFGIRLLNLHNPTIVPWAWAVNACATVIGSILVAILSMSLGFNLVLGLATGVYAVGFAAVGSLLRRSR